MEGSPLSRLIRLLLIIGLASPVLAQTFPAPGPGKFTYVPPPCTSGSCTDTFSGTAGTALGTYSGYWLTAISPYDLSGFQLGGSNTVRGINGSAFAGAVYSPSTSNISQAVLKANTGPSTRSVNTNMTTGAGRGYAAAFYSGTGTYPSIALTKNGSGLGSIAINTPYTATVDRTVTLRTRGTSPLYIDFFVDGNIIDTYVDASSPLSGGNTGITLVGGGAQADTYFGQWWDNFGSLTIGQPLFAGPGSCAQSTVLGTTVSCTLTAQGGEVLLIGYAWDDTTHTISSIVDSSGDTVTNVYAPLSIAHPFAWNGGASSFDMYTVKNATAGTHTITITMSGVTVVKELGILGYTGASTSAPIVTANNPIAIASITNPFSCNSITTTSAQSVVAAFGGSSGSVSRSAGPGFFMRQPIDNAHFIWIDQVVQTASTVTPTIATSTTGITGFCAAVAIK